ncbi:MAG: hypothetical protein HYZ11_13775 [Candidatus Tectomicrobia bacterium]|uniref:Uncharacterized protein n=1 Tax=Tectimicrobiota bacterium TaxID=2528274 RepID=A0A932MPB2_UNCTE|nr:hypothetical protein [Candidatus Tectomicrobia bacterium]
MLETDINGPNIEHLIMLSWILMAGAGVFVVLRSVLGFLRRKETPSQGTRRD